MEKIRFGVIGAGGIADRRTIPGMKLARNAELTAVMELNPAVAEQLRVKHGAKRAYNDAAALRPAGLPYCWKKPGGRNSPVLNRSFPCRPEGILRWSVRWKISKITRWSGRFSFASWTRHLRIC